MYYYNMKMKLFLMIKSLRLTEKVFKSSMILNHFNDKCEAPNRKLSSIAIQSEQPNVTNDCVSKGVQYEQDYFSCGTQCNIMTKTTGVQCSLDNTPDLLESYNPQSNSLQCGSKSTQWSEDKSLNICLQLCDDHTKDNDSIVTSGYITSTSPKNKSNEFPKQNAASTSCSQISGENLSIKQSRLKSGKKNLSASTLFGSVIRQRKNTHSSSTTSGITEMFSSRSDLESVGDSAVSVERCQSALNSVSPVQVVRKKKKHLWSAQDSVASISGSECSLDFTSLYPETQKTFPKCKCRSKTSVQSRCKYTYDEELTIIKYISEKNVYKQVRGVAMWQSMETEIEINRTWQSLKEHFRKKILPNIDEFDLPKKVEESFHRINMK